MLFYIMAKADHSQPEVIDTANSLKEARFVADEYRLALGDRMGVWATPVPSEEEEADFLMKQYLI